MTSLVTPHAYTIRPLSASSSPSCTWNDGVRSHNDSAQPLNYFGPPYFGDYPQIGVDSNGVYLSTNQFTSPRPPGSPSPTGQNIYAVSKQLLLGKKDTKAVRFALPMGVANQFRREEGERGDPDAGRRMKALKPGNHASTAFLPTTNRGTLFPVQTTADPKTPFDTRFGGVMYFAAIYNSGQVLVLCITNTSSLVHPSPRISLLQARVRTPNFSPVPNVAPQRPGPIPYGASVGITMPSGLDTNAMAGGFQSLSATLRGGAKSIWATWTVATPSGASDTVAGAAVAQLLPTLTASGTSKPAELSLKLGTYKVLQVPEHYILFPQVTMNSKGKGLVAFSLSGPQFYPSVAYTTLNNKGTFGTSIHVAVPGAAPLDDGSTSSRYGDFQSATVDENGEAWAFVEYVSGKHQAVGSVWQLIKGVDFSNWATYALRVEL